ncbi:MAG TPA: plastocyanin/azurin family copper-binding protein [Candidatus Thalassarchaeaceae archaeon]|nr:plastocyanin/azurin family copper-binding protein [Candidatus Thalassarchaeaceae archaeon]HJM67587.1 plastocyanin/azurin family copper-binding protein [Candidatus Thalassarchaeaceae archaeon]
MRRDLALMRTCSLLLMIILVTSMVLAPTSAENTEDEGVTHEVAVGESGLTFTPDDLEIEIGDTVRFIWTDEGMDHNVAEAESSESNDYKEDGFRSGDPVATVDFNVTFDEVGSFYYVCEPHAGMGMKGTIIVNDPNAVVPEPQRPTTENVPGFLAPVVGIALMGAALIRKSE